MPFNLHMHNKAQCFTFKHAKNFSGEVTLKTNTVLQFFGMCKIRNSTNLCLFCTVNPTNCQLNNDTKDIFLKYRNLNRRAPSEGTPYMQLDTIYLYGTDPLGFTVNHSMNISARIKWCNK